MSPECAHGIEVVGDVEITAEVGDKEVSLTTELSGATLRPEGMQARATMGRFASHLDGEDLS